MLTLPGQLGQCRGLREARPSSERAVVPQVARKPTRARVIWGPDSLCPGSSTPTWQSLGGFGGSLSRELDFWDGSR